MNFKIVSIFFLVQCYTNAIVSYDLLFYVGWYRVNSRTGTATVSSQELLNGRKYILHHWKRYLGKIFRYSNCSPAFKPAVASETRKKCSSFGKSYVRNCHGLVSKISSELVAPLYQNRSTQIER